METWKQGWEVEKEHNRLPLSLICFKILSHLPLTIILHSSMAKVKERARVKGHKRSSLLWLAETCSGHGRNLGAMVHPLLESLTLSLSLPPGIQTPSPYDTHMFHFLLMGEQSPPFPRLLIKSSWPLGNPLY